jgi:hypothetical protein
VCCVAACADAAPAPRTRNPIEKSVLRCRILVRLRVQVKKACCAAAFRDAAPGTKNVLTNHTLFIWLRIRERNEKLRRCSRSCNIRSGSGIEINVNKHCIYKIFSGSASCAGSGLAALFFTHIYRHKFTISAATKSGQFCPKRFFQKDRDRLF